MRILPIALFFILIAGTGLWIAAAGPENFPNTKIQIAETNTETTSPTNTATNQAANPAPPLPAPTGLTVLGTTVDSVTLSWPAVTNASAYRLYRDGKAVAEIEGAHFLDIGLAPATTYTYAVVSIDANQQTSTFFSTVVSALTKSNAVVPTNTNTSTPTPTPTPKLKPTPAPTPTPSTPACGSGGACTPSQVASHATRSNCWVYLSPINKVYNITAYVANASRHPGGDVIAAYCGKNIYSYFIGSLGDHPHSSQALNSTLQAYYIGPLQS